MPDIAPRTQGVAVWQVKGENTKVAAEAEASVSGTQRITRQSVILLFIGQRITHVSGVASRFHPLGHKDVGLTGQRLLIDARGNVFFTIVCQVRCLACSRITCRSHGQNCPCMTTHNVDERDGEAKKENGIYPSIYPSGTKSSVTGVGYD